MFLQASVCSQGRGRVSLSHVPSGVRVEYLGQVRYLEGRVSEVKVSEGGYLMREVGYPGVGYTPNTLPLIPYPPGTTKAGGMQPTGMLSSLQLNIYLYFCRRQGCRK